MCSRAGVVQQAQKSPSVFRPRAPGQGAEVLESYEHPHARDRRLAARAGSGAAPLQARQHSTQLQAPYYGAGPRYAPAYATAMVPPMMVAVPLAGFAGAGSSGAGGGGGRGAAAQPSERGGRPMLEYDDL